MSTDSSLGLNSSEQFWKDSLKDQIPDDWAEGIDNFETEIYLKKQNKIEDKKIGMGKLKPITKNIFEIAGVYIDDSYRYQGYADSIIQHLLKEIKPGQEVYSIVPDKTSPLYKKAGFKQLGSGQYPKIIKDIRDKRETSYPSYGKFLILKWTQED